jgi:hypothetical protein
VSLLFYVHSFPVVVVYCGDGKLFTKSAFSCQGVKNRPENSTLSAKERGLTPRIFRRKLFSRDDDPLAMK